MPSGASIESAATDMERAYVHRPQSHSFVEAMAEGMARRGVSLVRDPEQSTFVAMGGFHDQSMVDWARENGRPILLGDLGYLRRSNSRDSSGYFQLGWDRIGWIPSGPLPDDRLEALALDIQPDRPPPPEGPWVIASQVPEDRQHGMDIQQLGKVYAAYIRLIRLTYPEARIVFRAHPHAPLLPPGVADHPYLDEVEREGGIAESLERAGALVTFNSTSFYDAWLRGVPVFCDPSAHYWSQAAGAVEDIPRSKVRGAILSSVDRKRLWLSRVAYAQWTLAELAEGVAWDFVAGRMPR